MPPVTNPEVPDGAVDGQTNAQTGASGAQGLPTGAKLSIVTQNDQLEPEVSHRDGGREARVADTARAVIGEIQDL